MFCFVFLTREAGLDCAWKEFPAARANTKDPAGAVGGPGGLSGGGTNELPPPPHPELMAAMNRENGRRKERPRLDIEDSSPLEFGSGKSHHRHRRYRGVSGHPLM